MSNVKLAIRVRPFTEKELRSEKDRIPVVSVLDANSVTITNIKVSLSGAGDSRERTRRYYADYTYDSSCPVTQSTYASQDKVFETIGRSVISSVTQGSSACVLAYGQSATGKTHTMMGTETQRGLIPRLCEALYQQQNQDYTISFLEIYNERVHDLLCDAAPVLPTCHSLPRRRGNACKDLRVREHPQRGTYVQNLRRVLVHNVEALLSLVEEGVKRRRTAATRRNNTSSRSHALLEITTPHATLHLADLAGSEKASWEGCGGGRQKEGANINKSLVALSNVISALVSEGTGRGRFVPYRDSALTWLLKDCFTGGANTFIIATVSPSAACYGESASTLRWAARARQLPTPRPTNNSLNVVSKAALQAQFNQLIAELTRNNIQYIPETGKIEFDERHWIQTQNVFASEDLKESAKIGNITNIMMRPKSDANHSESTASSVASGSSDVINVIDKNINIADEINEEIDKFFGPALERTSSGDNLKINAPLRHRIRQYRSQEILPVDETIDATKPSNLSVTLPTQRKMQINTQNPATQKSPPVTILHDNQRAEIVASVTERLYSKLKNKEKHAKSRVESIVDRKIVEPLSELKICTNARQRLMELSQKAIRTRRRIGIPAHTQTRKFVTRVRDQAIEVQADLYSYIEGKKRSYTINKDAATETVPMVPRYKDIGVGPTGSLSSNDISTGTKLIIYRDSDVMTEIVSKIDRATQTHVVPPPRKKKHVTKLIKPIYNDDTSMHTEDCPSAPVISINILHKYALDSESQTSDDNSEDQEKMRPGKVSNEKSTPDLLTNHSNSDSSNLIELDEDEINVTINVTGDKINTNENTFFNTNVQTSDFPDMDDVILPRVSPSSLKKVNESELKSLILGRNKNVYPYNIVISPPRQRETKRVVTFKNIDDDEEDSVASGSKSEGDTDDTDISEFIFEADCLEPNQRYETSVSETDSSNPDSDSFIWNKAVHSKDSECLRKSYMPVYKTRKFCAPNQIVIKDCLAFENKIIEKSAPLDIPIENNNDYLSYSDGEETDNLSKCKFSQPKYGDKFDYDNNDGSYWNFERKLLDSCKYLEASVTKYETYVTNFERTLKTEDVEPSSRKPKDYLKHLVNLRRKVVEAENDMTDYKKRTPQE